MESEQAKEWPEVTKEEIQSFLKHETSTLIPKNDITLRQCPIKRKLVYKIKQCVDN